MMVVCLLGNSGYMLGTAGLGVASLVPFQLGASLRGRNTQPSSRLADGHTNPTTQCLEKKEGLTARIC